MNNEEVRAGTEPDQETAASDEALLEGGFAFEPWAAAAAAHLLSEVPQLRLPCLLGPYRVTRHLATGGMGQVYEAEDPRLKRKVAIKILHFGAVRQLRYESELLARFKHPNVCQIFDVGNSEGVDYLVMELLDGISLRSRLRQGPLPLDEALSIGRALASALAEAHRLGIVHRDVKPPNILLTRNGPSLIDFGIAEAEPSISGAAGTPGYMAPEQAHSVSDARSDIYSLGAVLKEMTEASQPLPMPVSKLIQSCMCADPNERWQSAADLARALEWIGQPVTIGTPRPARPWRSASVALLLIVAAASAFLFYRGKPAPHTVLIPVRGPRGASISDRSLIALSPEGTRMAIVASGEAGESLIWIRKLNEAAPEALPATVGGYLPFWSPDGRSIGFFRNSKLETLDLVTGQLRVVTEVAAKPWSASWGLGNRILYSFLNIKKDGVIYSVPAGGGQPARVTNLDQSTVEQYHYNPLFFPDGQHFLYLASGNPDLETTGGPGTTYSMKLGEQSKKLLLRGASALGIAGNRVYYQRGEKLWSQHIDVDKQTWVGEPKLEIPQAAWAQISSSAHILYAPLPEGSRPTWLARNGRKLSEVPVPTGEVIAVGVSPDGTAALISRKEEGSASMSLWLAKGNEVTRIGPSPQGIVFPIWSHDGESILYGNRTGLLRRRAQAGSEEETLLEEHSRNLILSSTTPDGDYALGVAYDPVTRHGFDIFRFNLKSRTEQWWSATAADETIPRISPDGRWVAWLCEYPRPGRLCLSPFSNSKDITYISQSPAMEPLWSGDGSEIFHICGSFLCSIKIRFEAGRPVVSSPESLFRFSTASPLGPSYAASPDGGKFLVREMYRAVPDPLLIWTR